MSNRNPTGDIPSYGTVSYGEPRRTPSREQALSDEIAATRRRTIEAIHRCLARLASAAGEDWRHCGKAACLRSRRCRGFACEIAETK